MSTLPSYESAGPGAPSEGGYSALEVSHRLSGTTAPEVYSAYDGLEVVNDDTAGVSNKVKVDSEAAIEEQVPQKSPRKRKLWIVVGAIVLLVVVVAAVVGGVVGSRHHNSTTSASSSSNPSSTSSPTSSSGSSSTPSPTPSSNSPNAAYSSSSIAVTGWWTSTSSYSIRLFYQGKDEQLRMIGYDSSDGMWSTVTTLTDPDLRPGSPLATCNYNSSLYFNNANNYTQIDIFYVDKSGQIQEWEVIEQQGQPTKNVNGTISSLGLKPGANTRLATYWPSLIFQDDLNQLQETYFTTSSKWLQNPLNVSPQNHSALAEIVFSASSARSGGGNFIYQDDDHKLQAEGRSSSTTALKADTPAVSIPSQSPIGAFSVPRNSQSNSPMNTYILWQNSTGGIQITWTDDDSGWQTISAPDSFGTPDKGTDIACLTPSAYSLTPLQPKYDMARCYYLVGGRVREVKYDGSNWSVVGNVPLG